MILSETAGFRSTRNQIELEGIKRSEELARGADLIVLVLVASDADLPSWMRSIGRAVATSHLTVIDKADLVGEAHKSRLKENAIWVSSVTREGIDCLVSTQQSAVVRQESFLTATVERQSLGCSTGAVWKNVYLVLGALSLLLPYLRLQLRET